MNALLATAGTGKLTLDYIEVIWMLVALPGLAVWVSNTVRARANVKAARTLTVVNGRLLAAVHLLRVAWVFVAIETFFVTIGATSMLRISDPDEDEPIRLFIAFAVIGISAAITWMGYERRRVETELLRLNENKQDVREVEQNTRETGQNIRESEQNRRDSGPGHIQD